MIKIKINNNWKKIIPKIKVGGKWKKITKKYIKENGTWKIVFIGSDIKIPIKSFNGYTTLITKIPISEILNGIIDEYSNNQDPVQLISVQNAIGGSVLTNNSIVEFHSNSGIGEPASFSFTVQNSIGKTKNSNVILNIIAIPPIVCNTDTFNLQQGESTIILGSSLMSNDTDSSNGTLTFVNAENAVGGVISLNGNNITFTSTGISGQPANFTYNVRSSNGGTGKGLVNFNITPLPKIDVLIYETSGDTNTATNSFVPPTMIDIFNTWARFDGANYFTNKSAATGSALHWQLLSNPDRISQPDNTAYGCGFISPDLLDNYTFEATLTSDNSDNDTIGLIIAFVRDGSINKTLAAVRTKTGQNPSLGWGLIYTENGQWEPTWTISNKTISTTSSGWSSAKSRIKIQRSGNIIQAWCTNWNNTVNYEANSELLLDLNNDPRLAIFKGKKSYGYYTHSQTNSTYLDVKIKGALNYNQIMDIENNTVWEYINDNWVNTEKTIQSILGYIRTVKNPLTGISYLIKENVIEKLGIID